MLRKTEYRLDLRSGDHRALLLRAYFSLLAEGVEPEAARLGAPKLAMQRWRDGQDYPGFYPRRSIGR